MRTNVARLAGVSALALAPVLALAQQAEPTRGEAELAELLAGRVAGAPVKCLTGSRRNAVEIVDGTALVFREGATIYVNRPAGARILDWNDLPVFRISSGNLCANDQVEVRDRSSLFPGPTLLLGEFVPYRRAPEIRASEGV